MGSYYFFGSVYAILTIRFFFSHPINMSEPLDRILIAIPVFWASIGFLIYKKEKYGKMLSKERNACKTD